MNQCLLYAIMSITLNNSDFQCLQDQLVDLKAKNYELAEKNRRGQADFEAAKAKICSLQLKLEEQERDFQIISSTLRREIDSVTGNHGIALTNDTTNDVNEVEKLDYKTKYKELSLKNEELQQKNQESVDITQQLDKENKSLTDKICNIEEENVKLMEELKKYKEEINVIKKENEAKLSNAIEEIKVVNNEEKDKLNNIINDITNECDNLRKENERLSAEVNKFDQRLEIENEERKIQERKGLQMVKELKRQLALVKNSKETLQKRIEHLLSQPPQSTITVDESTGSNNNVISDIDATQLSTSSKGNGSSNGNGSRANQDTNSVGSWSFVPNKQGNNLKSSTTGLNETISLCSIDSGDHETVQHSCDTNLDNSIQKVAVNNSLSDGETKQTDLSSNQTNFSSPSSKITFASFSMQSDNNNGQDCSSNNTSLQHHLNLLASSFTASGDSQIYNNINHNSQEVVKGMLLEEQAALVERLTKLQHDKWQLEEKLSYLEQANSSLSEDLANKSDIIKQYFMDQAIKAMNSSHSNNSHNHHYDGNYNNIFNSNNNINNINNSRRTSFSNNVNHLLTEKPSIKKVVDFLKEKSQSSISETENISREATRKMQLMLEETLIKCIKLQENLDFVTSEMNKIKSQ